MRRGGLGAQQFGRMWVKGQDERTPSELAGKGLHAREELLVPAMYPVEAAEGSD